MKNFFKFISTCTLSILFFTSCGKEKIATNSKKVEKENIKFEVSPQLIGNPNGSIEITWQPNASHSLSSSVQSRVDYLRPKILEWVKKNPDVKIIPISGSGNNQENLAKMLMQADQGRAPDIVAIDSFMLPMFYKYLQPITNQLTEHNIDINDWFSFASTAMKPSDNVMALWYTTDIRNFYYRKDLISEDKVPQTWEQLLEIGKDMLSKGYTGFIYPAGRNEAVITNHLPYLWAQNYDLVSKDGKPIFGEGKAREAMINWFTFFKNTIDDGITPKRVSTFDKDASMVSEIASGKTAMFLGSNSLVSQMREVLGKENFDKLWGVAPIPMYSSTGMRTSTAGGYVTGFFTKDPEKLKIAVDFIMNIYVNDTGMTGWAKYGGYLPPRESIYSKDSYFAEDPYMLAFKKELEYARTRPAVEIYPVISEELQVQIGKVITGESTPVKAVDDAWKAIQKRK